MQNLVCVILGTVRLDVHMFFLHDVLSLIIVRSYTHADGMSREYSDHPPVILFVILFVILSVCLTAR